MDERSGRDDAVSRIAAAIGEPARARILYCLVDGHARTSTELSVVAGVSPSTASVHLNRLKTAHLVKVLVQGKHRFYSLEGPDVATALEGLSVLAGGSHDKFVPSTPSRLRAARTCYDHMAGKVGVLLHDRFKALGWLAGSNAKDNANAKTMATTSPQMEPRRSRLLELTSRQLGRCAAGSRARVWIGVSGGLTSAGRWGQPF